MTVVRRHIEHLDAMLNSVEDVLREILIEHEGEIVNLVKYDQLSKGFNSRGGNLKWKGGSGFYAESTQEKADKAGVSVPKTAGAPYNFYWSGETFDSMGFKLTPKSYEVFTSQYKMNLFQTLGYGDIFSLTKEHNDYVNKKILEPELVKWIDENWWRLTT